MRSLEHPTYGTADNQTYQIEHYHWSADWSFLDDSAYCYCCVDMILHLIIHGYKADLTFVPSVNFLCLVEHFFED
jgi:hypothetical protein